MAGIGFRLRAALEPGTYGALLRGHAFAAVIAAGPWIVTVTTLSLIGRATAGTLGRAEHQLFQSSVTACFVFSLISTGVVQMALCRYLSDRLYDEEESALLPSLAAICVFVATVQGVAGMGLFFAGPFDALYRLAGVGLYVTISLLWVVTTYLSTARDYVAIARAFAMGGAVAVGAAWGLGAWLGVSGMMLGFAAGQQLTLALLLRRLVAELPDPGPLDWRVLRGLTAYPSLLAIGLLYNLGIWADKLLFWVLEGARTAPLMYFNPLYDNATYLAFLTVIPALGAFAIHVETGFYVHYRRYFEALAAGASLSRLRELRGRMVDDLGRGLQSLVRLQGGITLVALVVAPHLLGFLGLKWIQLGIFRIVAIGAFFNVLFLVVCIVLLYFDFRAPVAWLTLGFAGGNFGLTLITIGIGLESHGLGYALASLGCLVTAYVILERRLGRLEHHVLTAAARRPASAGP